MTAETQRGHLKSSPVALAHLMAAANSDEGEWTADELGDLLRHQLSCPLALAVNGISSELAGKAAALAAAQTPAVENLLSLFRASNPSVELLQVVKELAKRARQQKKGLPEPMWLVVYHGCIACALVRRRERITRLDDAALIKAFRWAVAEPWVLEELRAIFVQAEHCLSSGSI